MRKLSAGIKMALRGSAYWLLTRGPIGTITGMLFQGRGFDRLGSVAVPSNAKPDIIGAIIYGVYEYPERVLINRWLPSDLDCIELGCSIGVISRIILRKLNPTRRLLAIEASEELLALAKSNVAISGFGARFIPVHGAVHYDGDTVLFNHHAEHIRGKVVEAGNTEGSITPCVTLAHIIRTSELGPYSLVMDIEGSEFDLVARDLKSLVKCQAIIAELHGGETATNEFIKRLKEAGFVVAEIKHSVFAFVRSPPNHAELQK